jgi:hypothetical protein
LLKALAAIDGTTLSGLERDRSLFPALRAGRLGFRSLDTGTLAGSVGALSLAGLTPLGLILEALVCEEHLFSGGEDELSIALRTL